MDKTESQKVSHIYIYIYIYLFMKKEIKKEGGGHGRLYISLSVSCGAADQRTSSHSVAMTCCKAQDATPPPKFRNRTLCRSYRRAAVTNERVNGGWTYLLLA